MKIIYKIEKIYDNVNDLFKLLIEESNIINIFSIIIVQIEKAFLKKIIIKLFKNPYFDRIYDYFQK